MSKWINSFSDTIEVPFEELIKCIHYDSAEVIRKYQSDGYCFDAYLLVIPGQP